MEQQGQGREGFLEEGISELTSGRLCPTNPRESCSVQARAELIGELGPDAVLNSVLFQVEHHLPGCRDAHGGRRPG